MIIDLVAMAQLAEWSLPCSVSQQQHFFHNCESIEIHRTEKKKVMEERLKENIL